MYRKLPEQTFENLFYPFRIGLVQFGRAVAYCILYITNHADIELFNYERFTEKMLITKVVENLDFYNIETFQIIHIGVEIL